MSPREFITKLTRQFESASLGALLNAQCDPDKSLTPYVTLALFTH
jgi:hypothetical protein